jgi:hypothetical protein
MYFPPLDPAHWLRKLLPSLRWNRHFQRPGTILVILCLTTAAMGAFAIDYWLESQKARKELWAMTPQEMENYAHNNMRNAGPVPHYLMSEFEKNRSLKGVGTLAPDFSLPDASTGNKVRLSVLCQKKPVVLLFGSFG